MNREPDDMPYTKYLRALLTVVLPGMAVAFFFECGLVQLFKKLPDWILTFSSAIVAIAVMTGLYVWWGPKD
jgi:hypothetical protein